jgi:hypothetical protein
MYFFYKSCMCMKKFVSINYLDLLTDDLIEKILDILTKDYHYQINLLDDKIKTIQNLLEPLSSYYDKVEDYNYISYDNIYYSINKRLFERVYIDNMILINKYDRLFSVENAVGDDYISKTLHNPTYLDILAFANKSVVYTGDYHHIFLEGINKIDNKNVYKYFGITPKYNYKYYEFMLRS